ncbi:MAG: hypothetical protein ACTSU3_08055 [Candidatus Thorarchaeota archaeon]
MHARRKFLIPILVVALLLAFTPQSVKADVAGSIYNFSATWEDTTLTVDNVLVYQNSFTGTFQIEVYNLTSSDNYEYNFAGFNYYEHYGPPFIDDQNDSVDFLDSRVYFDLETADEDDDNLADDIDIDMYPHYYHHTPGNMFFVNPTWSTHDSNWNAAISDLDDNPTINETITESANEGVFSFRIVVNAETENEFYGNMTGTNTIVFGATYDADGVLSTWDLTQTIAMQNENHTTIQVTSERYSRGAGVGPVIVDPALTTQIALLGGASVACLIIGVVIGRKY